MSVINLHINEVMQIKFWVQVMVLAVLVMLTVNSYADRPLYIPKRDGAEESDAVKRALSSDKISQAILDEFDSIDRVYGIAFGPAENYDINFKLGEGWRHLQLFVPNNKVVFLMSFTVVTAATGITYSNIQCRAYLNLWDEMPTLNLSYCGNDQAHFKRDLDIPLSEVYYN